MIKKYIVTMVGRLHTHMVCVWELYGGVEHKLIYAYFK